MSEETAPQILRRVWVACRDLLAESGGKTITSYEVARKVQLDHALVAEGLRSMDYYLFMVPHNAAEGREMYVEVQGLDQEYEAR
ncbi:hypothetical protein JOF29_004281 [Kribbella aluminosa]|uniref:MarR family transcriptional regulator n=1 Tax=Kribbella aluminosa TaxID=416017 RepID=A0ABS4UNH7_9ACTN|nr:hypothetical protein [Kribbella aluminosa]MBP2353198.1 hypothetical protein [Kribbella aluminosa]